MKKTAAVLLLAAAFISSCKKDNNDPGIQSIADLLATYDQSRKAPVESVDMQYGRTFTSLHNIRITIPAHAFVDNAGNPFAGNASVRVLDYFSNSDLLFGNISTATADSTLLVTGGMFYITATANGQTLSLAPGKEIEVYIPSKGTLNQDFSIFRGNETAQSSNRVAWVESSVKWVGHIDSVSNLPFYTFSIPGLNWWNLDHYADLGNGRTKVAVTLPAGYSNTNTMVMLLMPDNGGIFLPGDPAAQNFNSGNYSVPIGQQVKIVSISNNGGLRYNLQTLTVSSNMNVSVSGLQPVSTIDLVNMMYGL